MSKVINAAKNGYKKKLDTLLADGHSVDTRDEKQATALFWGACRGHSGICGSLISAGADINARVTWGATPLHAAADTGHTECIKILLKFHADINAQNNRGDTPLHLACYRGFTDIVSLLLKSGADVSLKNNQGKTPYVEADGQKHLAVLKILQPQMTLQRPTDYRNPVHSLKNIQYSTEYIYNSFNNSIFPDKNMRIISFPRNSEAQENEDTVGCHSDIDSLSSDMDILNLDKISADTGDMQPSYKSVSSFSEDTSLKQQSQWWVTESVDCKRSDQSQMDVSHLRLEMQRMRKSLKEQDALIKKLRDENEKLKEIAEQRKIERIKADENCLQLASQIARLKQKPFQYSASEDSNSPSDFSSCSDLSASPDQIISPTSLFCPKYPPSISGSGSSSLTNDIVKNGNCTSSTFQDYSHKSVQELFQQETDWKSLDLTQITKKVSELWLEIPNHYVKLDENDQGEWILGQNFKLRDNTPLNRRTGEQGDGTCSLVFRIKYKNHNLVLKMMTNLIDFHYLGHGQGQSLSNFLDYRFGAELIPSKLPPHRNLVKIIHHYESRTFRFQQFQHLLIPSEMDGLGMANQTLFFVMPEYSQTLKNFMINTAFTTATLETFVLQVLYQLLSAVYFLAKSHIVHRDIKPDNIFLDCWLRPVLADFGFAKCLRSSNGSIPVNHTDQIYAANDLAWSPEMNRWKLSVDPLINVSEEDVYRGTDSYSIGRMFYGILTTTGQKFPQVTAFHPHYSNNDLPNLPSYLSPGLRYVLQRLVLDKPIDRLTIRQAMLWTGMLLFPPEEMTQKLMVKCYIQAKMLTYLVLKPTIFQSHDDQVQLSVAESIQRNAQTLEVDFLCNVTVDEFWDIYQSITLLNSSQTNVDNLR